LQIYNKIAFYYDENNGDILYKNQIFHSFCYFLGYLLNIFPALISQRNSEINEKLITNEYEGGNPQSIKYIKKFFIICFILLIIDSFENISFITVNKNKEIEKIYYEQDFILIEFIVIYLFSKFSKEVF